MSVSATILQKTSGTLIANNVTTPSFDPNAGAPASENKSAKVQSNTPSSVKVNVANIPSILPTGQSSAASLMGLSKTNSLASQVLGQPEKQETKPAAAKAPTVTVSVERISAQSSYFNGNGSHTTASGEGTAYTINSKIGTTEAKLVVFPRENKINTNGVNSANNATDYTGGVYVPVGTWKVGGEIRYRDVHNTTDLGTSNQTRISAVATTSLSPKVGLTLAGRQVFANSTSNGSTTGSSATQAQVSVLYSHRLTPSTSATNITLNAGVDALAQVASTGANGLAIDATLGALAEQKFSFGTIFAKGGVIFGSGNNGNPAGGIGLNIANGSYFEGIASVGVKFSF